MEDMRILKRARYYIAAMSEGINPLTGEFVPSGDTVAEERIQKCCEYVAGILGKLIENGGCFDDEKIPFSITQRRLMEVNTSKEPIGINELAKRINAVKAKNMRSISGAMITAWLAKKGYLSVEKTVQTKESVTTRKVLNERSRELGITAVESVGSTGKKYERLMYSDAAQRFILDNLNNIVQDK